MEKNYTVNTLTKLRFFLKKERMEDCFTVLSRFLAENSRNWMSFDTSSGEASGWQG